MANDRLVSAQSVIDEQQFEVGLRPMIRCTVSLPFELSITSVNFIAGAPSSTAVFGSGYIAPSMIFAQCTKLSRSGASNPHVFFAISWI